jgi:ankyrin repeat protein
MSLWFGDLQNERGIAPLGIAVGFNRTAIVSLLLEKGAQVDRRDPAGNTALHYAAGGCIYLTFNPSCLTVS